MHKEGQCSGEEVEKERSNTSSFSCSVSEGSGQIRERGESVANLVALAAGAGAVLDTIREKKSQRPNKTAKKLVKNGEKFTGKEEGWEAHPHLMT